MWSALVWTSFTEIFWVGGGLNTWNLGILVFLLHPLQTESVAYIAGRSEVLSATFVLLAWFLHVRRAGSVMDRR